MFWVYCLNCTAAIGLTLLVLLQSIYAYGSMTYPRIIGFGEPLRRYNNLKRGYDAESPAMACHAATLLLLALHQLDDATAFWSCVGAGTAAAIAFLASYASELRAMLRSIDEAQADGRPLRLCRPWATIALVLRIVVIPTTIAATAIVTLRG